MSGTDLHTSEWSCGTPVAPPLTPLIAAYRQFRLDSYRRSTGGHPTPEQYREVEADVRTIIAAHDRETAARTWDEGFVAGVNADMGDYEHPPEIVTNPYREGDPT